MSTGKDIRMGKTSNQETTSLNDKSTSLDDRRFASELWSRLP